MPLFTCPQCGCKLKVKDELYGRKVKCPQCGQAVSVPEAEAASPASSPVDHTLPPGPGVPQLPGPVAAHDGPDATQGLADSVAGPNDKAPGGELTDFLAPPQAADELGRLGPYRILKVLGAGGMGVVFRAEDPQLRRPVALKAMLPGLAASASSRDRFMREARSAAALDHDHIVHIYQVGVDRGVPYLAMQFLLGEPLDERLQREGKLPVAEALRIGRETAAGLAAAHARQLIHRDIKPANLWLEGERGRVKILDFGLARAAGEEAHLTTPGTIVGTPAYMAPEQAAGEDLDGRCDLFSLGCVLYRMFTGQMPFKGINTISTLMAVATEQPKAPHELDPAIPTALSDLILQLLAKKPDDRPASALAVVEALYRAGHDHTAELAPAPTSRKLAATDKPTESAIQAVAPPSRRRRLLPVGAALGLLCVVAVSIILWVSGGSDNGETPLPGPEPGMLPKPSPSAAPGSGPMSALALVVQPAELSGLRSWTVETRAARDNTRTLAFNPKGGQLASGGVDGTIRLLDPKTGDLQRCLLGHSDTIEALAWSPDGKQLASTSDDSVWLWDVAAGQRRQTLRGHVGAVRCLSWSPDGKRIASGGVDKTLRLWDADSGKPLTRLDASWVMTRVAWSPDGKRLASAGQPSTGPLGFECTAVWDPGTRKELRDLAGWEPYWGPDSRVLATFGGSTIRFYDADTGKKLRAIEKVHGYYVHHIAWSPDGKVMASSGHDQNVNFWDADSGKLLHTCVRLGFHAHALVWSPDSTVLAFATNDQVVAVNVAAKKTVLQVVGNPEGARATALSPTANLLAVGYSGGTVRLWDLKEGKVPLTLEGHGPVIFSVAWSPDGKLLAVGQWGPDVVVWDVGAGQRRFRVPGVKDVSTLAWSPDSRVLVSVYNGKLLPVDVPTGSPFPNPPGEDHVTSVAWSPDSERLAGTSDNESVVHLWEDGLRRHRSLAGHKEPVRTVAWSPDGRTLASGGWDRTVRLWDPLTGQARIVREGHTKAVLGLAWAPDGKVLASRSEDTTVRLWDAAEGRILPILGGHPGPVAGMAWSPDGKRLATLSGGEVRVWDAATGKLHVTCRGVRAALSVVWTADGRTLLAGRGDGSVQLWDADDGRPRAVLVGMRHDVPLAVGTEGHFVGAQDVEQEIVYVVETDGGQQTLSPAEFATRYSWRNDPARVRPMGK